MKTIAPPGHQALSGRLLPNATRTPHTQQKALNMFKAIVIEKDEAGYRAGLKEVDDSALPAGEVTVQVAYSTINYKDGLALTGKSPVVRKFPLHAGIDFAGTVLASEDPRFKPGDAVVLNGWGVGESHSGGLAQKARVKADWLVPLPAGLGARQAMAIGTAGYTAMLCVQALERHGVSAGSGDVLVTGANGGVGSVAIALLSKLGHRVVASTGRMHESDFLKQLGAAEVISREELSAPGKPLAKERWAAVVDSVGSHTLANACASTRYGGAVAACGLAQGMDLPASVAPFILRGIALYGIDSVMAPMPARIAAWARLARDLDMSKLDTITQEIGLGQAVQAGSDILAGRVRGRLVVNVNA
jgi:acrylyl-CoA reductase (NADPH)